MSSRPVAYFYLVLTMALWGAALVVARGVHEIAPPFALAFWRWLGAAAILLPFALPKLRREFPARPESRRRVLGICALMVVGTTLSIVRHELHHGDQRHGHQCDAAGDDSGGGACTVA